MQTTSTFDCAVIGTGAAGLTAAIAAADAGCSTIAIGPTVAGSANADPRTTALFSGSVAFLCHLGVWTQLERDAAPLTGLRLVDATGSILRAPEILFRAEELELRAFGYNVPNAQLLRALEEQARATVNVRLLQDQVISVTSAGDTGSVMLRSGPDVRARLVIGADGRRSITRAATGIGVRDWAYPQSAIVTTFRHSREHDGVSTEFHRATGPLTTVPLMGQASSLVWVEHPAEAQRLMQLAPELFAHELEIQLQGLLGAVREVGPRSAFPLSGASAERLTGYRVALIGEAAHVLPPIGAQGLNLGLRDAATLAELLADANTGSEDPGGPRVLAEYDRRRQADILSRTIAVDLLNRSLISGFLPLHLARGAGLHLLTSVPWLRRLVMQEGMQPAWELPRLMRTPVLGKSGA